MTLKEDFQRAIAQSQSGKSTASGLDRPEPVPDEFSGTEENLTLVKNKLMGKLISIKKVKGSRLYYVKRITGIEYDPSVSLWSINGINSFPTNSDRGGITGRGYLDLDQVSIYTLIKKNKVYLDEMAMEITIVP